LILCSLSLKVLSDSHAHSQFQKTNMPITVWAQLEKLASL